MKIQDKNNANNISFVLFVLMTARYVVAYNGYIRADQRLWLLLSAIVGIAFLYKIIRHKAVVQMSYFVWWAIAVYSYFLTATLWSVTKQVASPLKSLAMIYIMGILLSFIVINFETLDCLILSNYIGLILCGIYTFRSIDTNLLGVRRIGLAMEGMWNSNGMSQTLCFGALLAFYYFDVAKKWYLRLINLGIFIMFGYLVLYCGSRTGFLILVVGVFLYMFIKERKMGRVRALVIGALLILCLYYLVMNYEPLYVVLGSRLEQAANGLFGSGTSDASYNGRHKMIVHGWEWFLRRPIFGYGLENFRALYSHEYNFSTYSHNNFIELLVSGGIVGIAIYYSMYVYVISKLWAPATKERDRLAVCLFSVVITQFFIQFISTINYASTGANTILLLANIYIVLKQREARNNNPKRQGTE